MHVALPGEALNVPGAQSVQPQFTTFETPTFGSAVYRYPGGQAIHWFKFEKQNVPEAHCGVLQGGGGGGGVP